MHKLQPLRAPLRRAFSRLPEHTMWEGSVGAEWIKDHVPAVEDPYDAPTSDYLFALIGNTPRCSMDFEVTPTLIGDRYRAKVHLTGGWRGRHDRVAWSGWDEDADAAVNEGADLFNACVARVKSGFTEDFGTPPWELPEYEAQED